jgi:cell division protein FtsB
MKQLQHLWGIAYGIRRQLATWGLFLFAALLAVHVIFGTNGWMAYEKKKEEYRKVTQEVQQLQAEHEQIGKSIKGYQTDPEVIAREARTKYGFAKKGEVVIVIPERKQELTSTAQAGDNNIKK